MIDGVHYTPLYSNTLHIRVLRARTSCVTSLTILALFFWGMVVNHFARRTFPVSVAHQLCRALCAVKHS